MKAYRKYNYGKKLYNSEKKAKNIICLPLYPEMNKKDVKKITKILKNILDSL